MNKLTPEQITERRKESESYSHKDGRITQPGKFEGAPIFAPYYWNMGLEGFADDDNGVMYKFKFTADCEDFQIWPELRQWLGRKRTLCLFESESGFVSCY